MLFIEENYRGLDAYLKAFASKLFIYTYAHTHIYIYYKILHFNLLKCITILTKKHFF